ncbi:Ig-like domain-containing protein [Nocardioides lijunqiniae]|uniref:Ig-like domain-containing protein n=1 Tax=Nocardioides lijunqiniae TaxID=2760832 RepID=UPI001877D890|nr:Ig-like domain-containing protein [Nocardioides lijunqiniae]
MSAPPTPSRRGALALLAGLLPLATVLGLLPAASAVAEPPGGGEAPPLVVTVTKTEDPRYGDDLVFSVRSTGSEQTATVLQGDEVLASKEMAANTARFAIPTLGRFRAGTEYRLKVLVATETSSGESQLTVRPWFIGAHVTVASPTISYSAPLFGDLVPDRDTAVEPGGGTMSMFQGGSVRSTYAIRRDGTFALRDLGMTPGAYPQAHVYYSGDADYGATSVGMGSFLGEVTVVRMPTTTAAGISSSVVTQGDPVSILGSARSADPGTVADVEGDLVVSAAPVGSQDFTEIARAAYPGGNQALGVPLTEWASGRTGSWTIRVGHSGTDISSPSVAEDLRLRIDAASAVATSTGLTLDRTTTTAYGAPVTATARVTSADGSVPSGDLAFVVGGARVATVPVRPDGSAVARIPAGAAGTRAVSATYLGTSTHAGSSSRVLPVRVARTGSRTTVAAAKVRARRARLGIQVASTAPVAGTVVVRLGSRVVARGVLRTSARGRLVLVTKRLPAGRRTLVVSYAGSRDVSPSRSRRLVVRVR